MSKFIDITGQKFNRLLVLSLGDTVIVSGVPIRLWLCVCDCGTFKQLKGYVLRGGVTKSCGCFVKDSPASKTHGLSKTKTYRSWKAMNARCYSKNLEMYRNYGGRGIVVCDAWRDYEVFLKDMGERPPKMSIDRIDNNGNYEPGNCKWASDKEQARNRRTTHMIEYDGRTQCLTAWAVEVGMTSQDLTYRVRKYGATEALNILKGKKNGITQ